MTEVEMFSTLVANLGFPIAAFAAMWHMAHGTIKENTEAIRELRGEIRNQYE